MGKKRKILFFVTEWPALDNGVLHSQVLSVAGFLTEHDFECIFVGSEVSKNRADEATKIIKQKYGVNAYIYVVHSTRPGLFWRVVCAWKAYRKTCRIISKLQPTHIYSRSVIDARWSRRLASKIGAISIFDIRATLSEEVNLRRGEKNWRVAIIRKLEKMEIMKADRLACVSNNLKQYIYNQYGRQDITVIPSCFDASKLYFDAQSRREIRTKYRLNNQSILLCYSGGLAKWQRINDMLRLVEMLTVSNNNINILFLTQEAKKLDALLRETSISPERFYIESCSSYEIYRYLSAADMGLILRDDIIVNNVASPIKIGEYLACGLPLIMTKGIGDFSQIIPAVGLGVILNETTDMVEQITSFIRNINYDTVKQRAMEFGRNSLSLESQIENYKYLYG